MSADHGVPYGEWGGIFAGLTAVLALIGAGIRYLLGWKERSETSRAAKLQRWDDELRGREARLDTERAEYTGRIEDELRGLQAWRSQMVAEHAALKTGWQLLSAALRTIDPSNPALRMSDELLRNAFPPGPVTPAGMQGLIDKMDAAAASNGGTA